MTYKKLLNFLEEKLRENNLRISDAAYLLDNLMDKKDIYEYADIDLFTSCLKRLINKEAVQYIVGNVDFYGYNFLINNNVLIPKFETEELVDLAIKKIRTKFSSEVNIVDIGTGSGVIAITLKKELPHALVKAIDISGNALEVAKKNAYEQKADVEFIKNDLLSDIYEKFDVIISNPPYIKDEEVIDELVLLNEPSIALFGGKDGLDFYKRILKSKNNLKDKYLIAFEIGETQANDIVELGKYYFPGSIITTHKDMCGKNRFIFIESND